jgi:predicted DCC family thiol-disulfide oxidoreductase YuxK
MRCRKCKSENVKIEMVTEQNMQRKRKSFLYWITVGWLIEPTLWILLTIPKLIYELFKPNRYKMKSNTRKIAICQNCGRSWKA